MLKIIISGISQLFIYNKNYFLFRQYEIEFTGYWATYKNFRAVSQKVVTTNNTKEYIFPEEYNLLNLTINAPFYSNNFSELGIR